MPGCPPSSALRAILERLALTALTASRVLAASRESRVKRATQERKASRATREIVDPKVLRVPPETRVSPDLRVPLATPD